MNKYNFYLHSFSLSLTEIYQKTYGTNNKILVALSIQSWGVQRCTVRFTGHRCLISKQAIMHLIAIKYINGDRHRNVSILEMFHYVLHEINHVHTQKPGKIPDVE